MITIEIVPNYGVDYTTDTMAIAQWKSGKTFLTVETQRETTVKDWSDTVTVVIRYDRRRLICVVPKG